jgi:DNA replication and repair protein RecF
MRLQALEVQNFRNLAQVRLAPHPRFNLIIGDNAQGKTNLLEVVYLLGALKSFRTDKNRQLLGPLEPKARLDADVDRGGRQRRVTVEIHPGGKSVFLNQSPVRNLKDFFGTLNIVKFGPEDVSLLRAAPAERRKFLDRAIFQAHPVYAYEVSRYDEILKQRNSLLKYPSADVDLLDVYDGQLVESGARVVARRLDFLQFFEEIFVQTFHAIFDASFQVGIHYDSAWRGVDAKDVEGIAESFHRALVRRREDEVERGFTLSGPHRDDFSLMIGGKKARDFASQGQHRAMVLSLKIAQIRYLQSRYHFEPILLLDDVSSELDQIRNQRLFAFLLQETSG